MLEALEMLKVTEQKESQGWGNNRQSGYSAGEGPSR